MSPYHSLREDGIHSSCAKISSLPLQKCSRKRKLRQVRKGRGMRWSEWSWFKLHGAAKCSFLCSVTDVSGATSPLSPVFISHSSWNNLPLLWPACAKFSHCFNVSPTEEYVWSQVTTVQGSHFCPENTLLSGFQFCPRTGAAEFFPALISGIRKKQSNPFSYGVLDKTVKFSGFFSCQRRDFLDSICINVVFLPVTCFVQLGSLQQCW